jgi:hypothetical protein
MSWTSRNYGNRKGINRVLVGHLRERGFLRRQSCRWGNNIKRSLQEFGWSTEWSDLAQKRDRLQALMDAVMNLLFP